MYHINMRKIFFKFQFCVMMEITSVALYHKIDATETKQIIQL